MIDPMVGTMTTFKKSFTQQEPIPETAIARAIEVMRSGRLHRYNTLPGEPSEVDQLEREFAAYTGAKYCLACASGGYALSTALRAFGVKHQEPVLTNAFTLSPVPGAIAAVGGRPVLVEITENLVIDLADLKHKAATECSRLLLLSHMRGHIANMDCLMSLVSELGMSVIEDCAHTMGAAWRGTKSGRHGVAACYSTQTYKHMNSGEGGLIISDDAAFMARATILTGSYMFFDRHRAGPAPSVYTDIYLGTPNCSGRMDNLRAAILRPQLQQIDANRERWNARYEAVALELREARDIRLPQRPDEEAYVGSSIQFTLPNFDKSQILDFLRRSKERGVEIKWFGVDRPVGYTSRHQNWHYFGPQILPKTDQILDHLCDMRLPLTFSVADCQLIGSIICDCALATRAATGPGELSGTAGSIALGPT